MFHRHSATWIPQMLAVMLFLSVALLPAPAMFIAVLAVLVILTIHPALRSNKAGWVALATGAIVALWLAAIMAAFRHSG